MRRMRNAVANAIFGVLAAVGFAWHMPDANVSASGRASAQPTPTDCRYQHGSVTDFPEPATDDNTLVVNHRDLATSPSRLHVLKVDHGRYFQVVFECTAPQFFDYFITGDAAAQPGSADTTVGEAVMVTTPLSVHGTTMRHDERFVRYRVSARLHAGVTPVAATGPAPAAPTPSVPGKPTPPPPPPPAPPGNVSPAKPIQPQPAEQPPVQLYSVAFDVWVITGPDWRYGVIGGVAASGLVNKKYSITTNASGTKQFVESPEEDQDSASMDTMALAHVYYSRTYLRTLNYGVAVGFGTSDTSTRVFFGPSVVFGKYFVFTGGLSIGTVATPPQGQVLGQPPVNDNALNSLGSRRTVRPFFGVGFTWIDRRDQFAAALASASASGSIGSCVTAVKPVAVTFDAKGVASAAVEVEAGADCAWTATLQSGTNLFTIASGGSGRGKGTIKLSTGVAQEGGRSDVLNIVGPPGSAAKQVKLTQAGPS